MHDPATDTPDSVELPAPTAWPLVISAGIALVGAGLAMSPAFLFVGIAILLFGLGGWIAQLLSIAGHVHEPLVAPDQRAAPAVATLGTVEPMRPGAAGYRFRLPEKVHPISSGVKGGIVGGLLMPIPALAYGLVSQGSLWLPIN